MTYIKYLGEVVSWHPLTQQIFRCILRTLKFEAIATGVW